MAQFRRHRRNHGAWRGLVRRAAHRAPAQWHETRVERAHDSCVPSRQNESVWSLYALASNHGRPLSSALLRYSYMQLAVCATIRPRLLARFRTEVGLSGFSSSSEAAACWESGPRTNRVLISGRSPLQVPQLSRKSIFHP